MTVSKFAKAIGTGKEYVLRRIKTGEIPVEIKKRPPKCTQFYYDIDPALVPKWKKEVADKHMSPVSINSSVDKREYLSKDTPLSQVCRELNELEKQGIKLSYGQAVAKGYIPG